MKQSGRISLLIYSDSSSSRLMQLKLAAVEDIPVSYDRERFRKAVIY
jgi:hypothetical protein